MQGVTLCALGDFAANPIIHTIKNFPEDFNQHFGAGAATRVLRGDAVPAAGD